MSNNYLRYQPSFNNPDYDQQYAELRNGDDPDYPFQDTRPLHWRYPELESGSSQQGHRRYERSGHVEKLENMPTRKCRLAKCQ